MDTKLRALILSWIPENATKADLEKVARWMRDSLRLGGVREDRDAIRQARGV